jgi:hypothetical protein
LPKVRQYDKELQEAKQAKHIAQPSSREIKALNREQGLAKLKEARLHR